MERLGSIIRVPKDQLRSSELAYAYEKLTFRKWFMTSPSGHPPAPLKVFHENDQFLWVPQGFALKTWPHLPLLVRPLPVPEEIPLERSHWVGTLDPRRWQETAVELTLKAYDATGGGILCLPCGSGKTAVALYLVARMRLKTLIVVSDEAMKLQFMERIHTFMPHATVGKIQGDTLDVDGKDIVIAMMKSLAVKRYPPELWGRFGHAILDECHGLNAPTYSKILPFVTRRYTLGLSATPRRVDGFHKILDYFIGGIIFKPRSPVVAHGSGTTVWVFRWASCDARTKPKSTTTLALSKAAQALAEDDERTRALCAVIEEWVHSGRNVLVLADRRTVLETMERRLKQRLPGIPICFYWAERLKRLQRETRERAKGARIVLGTTKMASQGMDLDHLNSLVLSSPHPSCQQSVGRIMRGGSSSFAPWILDVKDEGDIYDAWFEKRRTLYTRCKWNVREYTQGASIKGPTVV